MPDIDIDFCFERRGEVIDYVVENTEDKVAQIITFGTMKAKQAIRDVGRGHEHELRRSRCHCQEDSLDLKMTIDKALEMNPELREDYDNNKQVRTLIDTARALRKISPRLDPCCESGHYKGKHR